MRRDNRRMAGGMQRRTGLAGALFTTTQQRVLALLFGQPSRSFRTGELIRLTGAGSGAVQRELKRLVASGLVSVSPVGNQRHHRANPDSPVFEDLRGLVLKTVAVAEPIRGALESLSDRVALALVFGSAANRADTAASDIDLLVVADRLTLEELYGALAPVEAALGRGVEPILYTTREFSYRKSSGNAFLARVLGGEHLVLIGENDGARATRESGQNG